MTTNCLWCQSTTEAYMSGDLQMEDIQSFDAHLASCPECSREVQGFRSLDPMVKRVFHRRFAVAQSAARWNTGPRVWRMALAGSGIAMAALIGVSLLTLRPDTPAPQIVTQGPKTVLPVVAPSIEEPRIKSDEPAKAGLSKPGEGASVPPAHQDYLDARPSDGADFVIVDSSGQAATLNDYRGKVLLFGIVSSDEKEATANLQDLYQTLGSRPNVRILGVASREDRIEAAFPIWFNHASRLLGTGNGQFTLVDAAGHSKLKGSLENAADVAKARLQLEQLVSQ